MRSRACFPAILLLLGLSMAACSEADPETHPDTLPPEGPLVVKTDKGPVEGAVIENSRAFLGIPYAAPPVGELRFKAPAPHAAWTDTLVAKTKGLACSQMKVLGSGFDTSTGEDCLTLNVWAPDRPKSDRLPVLVWIHGGGFTIGSGNDNAYDGRNFAEQTGTIVVSINYRLGPLGFLAHAALSAEVADHPASGNWGLEDQRAALSWVKQNIAAFGGDAGNVTVFGESAGGISTCLHLVSPKSKDLFQRAIIESGPCDDTMSKDTAEAQGVTFVEAIGCKDAADVLACLREKPIEAVMTALPSSQDFLFGGGPKWFPVEDGFNVMGKASKSFASGDFSKMPVIVGANDDEGTLFFALDGTMVPTDADFAALIEKVVPGHSQEILKLYPSSEYGSSQAAAQAAVGDGGFVCPARRTARQLEKGGASPFLYHFTYRPPNALLGDNLGAFHSSEVKFVLGNPSQILPQQLTDEELVLSANLMGYWSRFAAAGDPNGAGAFAWPKYAVASDENIVLDMEIKKASGFKKDTCDFWDTVEIKF